MKKTQEELEGRGDTNTTHNKLSKNKIQKLCLICLSNIIPNQ